MFQEAAKRLIYIAARLTIKLLRRLFCLKESYKNYELLFWKKGDSFERLNKAVSHSTGIGLFCLPILLTSLSFLVGDESHVQPNNSIVDDIRPI